MVEWLRPSLNTGRRAWRDMKTTWSQPNSLIPTGLAAARLELTTMQGLARPGCKRGVLVSDKFRGKRARNGYEPHGQLSTDGRRPRLRPPERPLAYAR